MDKSKKALFNTNTKVLITVWVGVALTLGGGYFLENVLQLSSRVSSIFILIGGGITAVVALRYLIIGDT